MSKDESTDTASYELLTQRLTDALAVESPAALTLARAKTTVGMRIAGQQIVLELHPNRVAVSSGTGPCEVQFELSTSFAMDFALGEATFLDGITSGRARATGPLRALLDVAPALRYLLRSTDPAPGPPPRQPRTMGPDRDRVGIGNPGDGVPSARTDAIEARDLWSDHSTGVALSGIDLSVHVGAITAILGPQNAGKTTLVSHLLGAAVARRGTVALLGRTLASMRPIELAAARRVVAAVPRRGALTEHLTVQEDFAVAIRAAAGSNDPDAAMHEAHDRLRGLALGRYADSKPSELTNLARTKIAFAKATLTDPRIIIFDSPEAGLDPVRVSLLCDFIRDYHDENGGTVLSLTSDPAVVSKLARYAVLLEDGRVSTTGDASTVLNEAREIVDELARSRRRGPGPNVR